MATMAIIRHFTPKEKQNCLFQDFFKDIKNIQNTLAKTSRMC